MRLKITCTCLQAKNAICSELPMANSIFLKKSVHRVHRSAESKFAIRFGLCQLPACELQVQRLASLYCNRFLCIHNEQAIDQPYPGKSSAGQWRLLHIYKISLNSITSIQDYNQYDKTGSSPGSDTPQQRGAARVEYSP